MDFLPTFCKLANIEHNITKTIDGSDISPVFEGEEIIRTTPLHWHFYAPYNGPNSILRKGNWMLTANWTGKNLKDINLESNIAVKGSKKIVNKFNSLFDLFWDNSDGMIYTIDYQGKYETHAGMDKWRSGENWGYVSW